MKNLIITFLFIVFSFNIFSQTNPHYVYVDAFPLLTKTIDVGYEYHILPYLSTSVSLGYAFNSSRGNILKKSDGYDFTNQSGAYIKTQIQFNIRKKISHFAPIIGLNLINALAVEEGFFRDSYSWNCLPSIVKKNSYNLAINGIIGVTSPSNKRLSFSLGLQMGSFLINNTLSFHSHIPGTGIRSGSLTFQGFAKVKFRIIPFKI